jgi:hypothetical protein
MVNIGAPLTRETWNALMLDPTLWSQLCTADRVLIFNVDTGVTKRYSSIYETPICRSTLESPTLQVILQSTKETGDFLFVTLKNF